MSLPLRECGLKSYLWGYGKNIKRVTPLAGVWIEMFELRFASGELLVTPLAGVWIEIWVKTWRQSKRNWSLPLRKCELKYLRCICYYNH